jgi:hypothetical protein
MTGDKRTYGFLIEEQKFADCPSVVARVLAREGDAEHPINPRSEGEDSIWGAPKKTDGLALQTLEIRCWTNTDPKMGYFHGPDVRFDSARFIDTRTATRLLATMKRIDREIRKADAREAGDVLMAVAKAIGATFSVHPVGGSRGGFYTDHGWRFGTLIEARDEFRQLVDKIKLLVPNKESAA